MRRKFIPSRERERERERAQPARLALESHSARLISTDFHRERERASRMNAAAAIEAASAPDSASDARLRECELCKGLKQSRWVVIE